VSWIQDLHNYIPSYSTQLDSYEFEEVSKQDGPGMGAVICYKNERLSFDLINDKGQFFISIGNGIHDKKHDLGFVIAISEAKKNNEVIRNLTFDEKIKYWEIRYDYSDPLKTFFDNIEELFSLVHEQHYTNTLEQLKFLLEDRHKWMFKL
jgi:hypothetical protein